MTEFVIGPGVQQAMADVGDEARSDEQYIIPLEGQKISRTFGRDAVWYWLELDNLVRRTPFEWDVEEPDAPTPPGIQWDANLVMAPQAYSWNCSACALDWVLRATWLAPETHTPNDALHEIGYPQNVNANYGLMDGTGRQLQRVLSDYGQESEQSYLDFDTCYQLATGTTGLMSGREWYHWTALRGTSGTNLWIANSAPGYRGVWSILSRQDYERLGSFNVVWLVEG